MSRYIDADALGIDYCNPDVFENKGYADGWNSAIKFLKDAPTVNITLVQHSRWYYHYRLKKFVCLECGFEEKHKPTFKYCPNCGAKMDEERR